MIVDKSTLRKIAHLARLDFEEKDEDKMIKDMTEILTWVEKLNELDTENVEPVYNMSYEVNQMREDVTGKHLPHDKGLLNAPKKDSDYFRVPKVLE